MIMQAANEGFSDACQVAMKAHFRATRARAT
jgi:hypothetical protein